MKESSLLRCAPRRFRVSLVSLLLMVCIPLFSQTYTITPSGWLDPPTTNITYGAITLHGNLLKLNAMVIGNSLSFNIKKKDGGNFQNTITVYIRQNSATGTTLQSASYSMGASLISHGYGEIDFTGSRTFVVVIKSTGANTWWYYTVPVTVTVTPTQSSKPTVTTNDASNVTAAEA